jgi:hypothetical protein
MVQSMFFRCCAVAVAFAGVLPAMQNEVSAQDRGGGRAGGGRPEGGHPEFGRPEGVRQFHDMTRTNVNRDAQFHRDLNFNRNFNMDVDNHRDYYPYAGAAGLAIGGLLAGGAIGSIAYALPPSCSPVFLNGITYQQCGSTWYQPQYTGTQLNYVVVPPP